MTKIIIRGYHLDAYQHVNNARYLEFLEEARWQHFDNISKEAYANMDFSFIIVNINIDYRLSATVGDIINIETEVAKIGNTSMTFKQQIFLDGTDKIVCEAAVTFVILNNKTGKPFKIEGELKSLLLKETSK
jgi:thioesterase-3